MFKEEKNMENKNFKNLDEVLKSIELTKGEIKTLKKDLKNISNGRIRRFFSSKDYEKQQFKLYQTQIKNQIKSKRLFVRNNESYLESLCTFDFDIATQFIVGVLSIVENEKFETAEIELDDSYTTQQPIGEIIIPLTHSFEDSFCLITTIQNIKEVLKLYDRGEINDSYDIEESIQNGKYISLELNDKYCLFDYDMRQVPEELTTAYPFLSNIICELISHRLENPTLTEQQLVTTMLQEISERYSVQSLNNKVKQINYK